MKLIRSSKLSLKYTTKSKMDELCKIQKEYTKIVNFFIDYLWDKSLETIDLKKNIYNLPQTWLSARMRQCAIREALGMVNSEKNKEDYNRSDAQLELEDILGESLPYIPTKPKHYGKKMCLSSQIVSLQKSKKSDTFDFWLVLTSIGNKINIKIPLNKHEHYDLYDLCENWNKSSTVTILKDYVQFSFETKTDPKKKKGVNVGIDVGINHLLATTFGSLLGNDVKALIAKIKSCKQYSKGYYRAKSTLSIYLNKIVKDFFKDNPNLKLVVVEKLYALKRGKDKKSKEFRKTLSNWNYRELLRIIESHCERNRVSFRSVPAYYTSQECPSCGHTQRENRKNEEFKCLSCGYSNQADLVGSLNILNRFLSGPYSAGFKT